jgi:hypothetical protein
MENYMNNSEAYGLRYWIVGYPCNNCTGDAQKHYLYTRGPWEDDVNISSRKDNELGGNFFISLRYYLTNTISPWFFFASEDAIIDFALFPAYIHSLEREKGNPFTVPIVQGSCINYGGVTYFQGGSGILMSRAAVLKFARNISRIESEYFGPRQHKAFDQMISIQISRETGISMYAASSRYWLGNTINDGERNIYVSKIPRCSKKESFLNTGMCRPLYGPLRDVVVWHREQRGSYSAALGVWKDIKKLPPNVVWWMSRYRCRPHLCLLDHIPVREF